jgi:hypothetical protein
VMLSSETEARSRGRLALDRDGASREGGVQPRARRSPARGGIRPSSETEPHPRERLALEVKLYRGGAVPLERSRVPPEGGGRFSGGPWVCFARAFRFVCVVFLRV